MRYTKNDIPEIFYRTGFMILMFLGWNILIASTFWFFDISISIINLPTSAILAIILCVVVFKKNINKNFIIDILAFIFILIITIGICKNIYSYDWDGNAYHKMAIGLMKNGWNPIKESSQTFCLNLFGTEKVNSHSIWVDHYGKATWIIAASIYAFTNNIECGKAYNLLGMIAFFLFLYHYLHTKKLSWWKNSLISGFLCCNPISLVQVFTFYIDGFLGIMLFLLILSLITELDDKYKHNRVSKICIISAMVVCGNTKFTGLFYGGIFCIAYYLYYVLNQYKTNKQWIKNSVKKSTYFIITAVVTVFWTGYTTYIMNFIQHGSPTFPLTGKGKIDIITGNEPSGFIGMSTIQKLFYSIFSKTQNVDATQVLPTLKVPFSFYIIERDAVYSSDVRIGGFGTFFGGLLIISIIVILYMCIKERFDSFYKSLLILNCCLILFLSMIVSESWWARYSPYQYLIIIFALIYLLCKFNNDKTTISNILMVIFLMVLINNNELWLYNAKLEFESSKDISIQFDEMAKNKSVDIKINNEFYGLLFDLNDYNVNYKIVDDFENDEEIKFTYYNDVILWEVKE